MDFRVLPLHDKIKELRTDMGWTQGELADKIGTDARMISQYEKGKSVPSVEYVINFAETFNVSVDYLLVEDAPKRPFKDGGDKELMGQFLEVNKLPEKDREMVKYMIDSVLMRDRLRGMVK
ncbi:MAG: helix-turn-helix transcriptional regulator [bacterium]|nr:helix-turn-helix transcriptional regulator [bacterium]